MGVLNILQSKDFFKGTKREVQFTGSMLLFSEFGWPEECGVGNTVEMKAHGFKIHQSLFVTT